MSKITMNSMLAALDTFSDQCELPNSIPEMQSWDARKSSARDAAERELESIFTPSQLRSLYDLTASMLADELAAEEDK